MATKALKKTKSYMENSNQNNDKTIEELRAERDRLLAQLAPHLARQLMQEHNENLEAILEETKDLPKSEK